MIRTKYLDIFRSSEQIRSVPTCLERAYVDGCMHPHISSVIGWGFVTLVSNSHN